MTTMSTSSRLRGVMAFIFNHSSNPRMYTSGQISQCEIDLGLTRKVASTTANQAMLQANLDRRHRFWNMPYPMGITDTVLEECIDIDECAITLNDCVRHVGKACLGVRVNEAGNYSRGQKFTLILGVRPNGPPVWQFSEARGTSGEAFSAFLENKVFPQLQGPTTLLWDNLRSHHTAQVMNLVHNSPHHHQYLVQVETPASLAATNAAIRVENERRRTQWLDSKTGVSGQLIKKEPQGKPEKEATLQCDCFVRNCFGNAILNNQCLECSQRARTGSPHAMGRSPSGGGSICPCPICVCVCQAAFSVRALPPPA